MLIFSAFPDSTPLKSAITKYTAMNSPVYILISSQLLSLIAVLTVVDTNNLHDSKQNDPLFQM